MVDIRPQDLNPAVTPIDADSPIIIDQGLAGVNRTTSTEMVNSVAPVVSQAEAEVGTDDVKRMTALKTKQSIASEVGVSVASYAAGQAGLSAVQSVNGKSGNAITLVKGDVGLGNVDNTSDVDKPVSTATQTALNGKLAVDGVAADSGKLGGETAQEWADKINVGGIYDTKAAVEAASVPASVNAIRLNGYYTTGDGEGALYKRVALEPAHAGKIQSADGTWWELASFKQPSIAAMPRTYTDRLRDKVSALDFYQPTDNGISHAVNRAIDFIASRRDDTSDTPKGAVILPNLGENYLVTTPVVLKSYVSLIGEGSPTLKLADGAAGNVVESENFWTYKGTGGASGDPGIHTFEFSGFLIDGNRKLCPSGEYGVAIYGRDHKVHDLRVRNAKKDGVFTQWRGGNVDTVFPFTSWEMESEYSNLKILGCGQAGFAHHGPHDSRGSGIICMHTGMDFAEHVQSLVSGGMPLLDALAASSDVPRYPAILIGSEGGGGYGFHLTDCHTWGRYNSYGVKVDVSGVSLSGNQFEGAYDAQVGIFAPRTRMSGNYMYCGGGDVYLVPNPIGLEVGAGVSTLLMDDSNSFSSVKTVVKKTGSSSGLNKIAGTIYSADTSARVFGGSGSWVSSDRSDMAFEGGITIGTPKPASKFEGNIRGSWIPTVSFATQGNFDPVYTVQRGTWMRVGDRVLFSVELAFSTNSYSGATGTVRISLPFTKALNTVDSVDIGRFANINLPAATNDLSPEGYITLGSNYFSLVQPTDNGNMLFLDAASMPANKTGIILEASGHYTVA